MPEGRRDHVTNSNFQSRYVPIGTLEKWAMFLLSTFIHLFSIITRIITYIPSYIYFVGIAFMFTTFLVLLFQSKNWFLQAMDFEEEKNVTFSILSETHLDFILTFPRGFWLCNSRLIFNIEFLLLKPIQESYSSRDPDTS